MSSLRFALGVALAAFVSLPAFGAEEIKSGLPPGESVGPWDVIKAAGAKDDGVKVGAKLCYR